MTVEKRPKSQLSGKHYCLSVVLQNLPLVVPFGEAVRMNINEESGHRIVLKGSRTHQVPRRGISKMHNFMFGCVPTTAAIALSTHRQKLFDEPQSVPKLDSVTVH